MRQEAAKRRTGIGSRFKLLAAAAAAFGLASCAPPEETDPQAALEKAMAGISAAESFAFSGRTEISIDGVTVQSEAPFSGAVAEKNRMYVQGIVYRRAESGWEPAAGDPAASGVFRSWNPVEKLEQLERLNKTVTLSRDPENAEALLLEAQVAPDDAAALVRQELAEQRERIVSEARLADFRQAYGLSPEETERLRGELEEAARQSGAQQEGLLASLREAGMTYRLRLDRSTHLPRQLSIELALRYGSEERDHEETVRAEYEFRDYDKPVMIPQQ